MPGLHGMENRDKQIRLNHGRWLPQHYPAQATEVACCEAELNVGRTKRWYGADGEDMATSSLHL